MIPRLKEILFRQLPNEIFLAHEALGVYMVIAEKSDFLKNSKHAHVFGIIQRHAFDALILCLCKIFEKESKKYPNYSIHTALCLFNSSLKNIAIPEQNREKLEDYIRTEIKNSIDASTPIPDIIFTYFSEQCPPATSSPKTKTLDALKVLRNKRIAHHENHDLSGLATTDFNGIIELLCFAQTFVNIIGYGFFGHSQKSIAQPMDFTSDKSESGRQMKRMIEELENNSTAK